MVFSDVLKQLRDEGHRGDVESRIRNGIRSGNVDKPKLDASQRFVYGAKNMKQIRAYLNRPRSAARESVTQ